MMLDEFQVSAILGLWKKEHDRNMPGFVRMAYDQLCFLREMRFESYPLYIPLLSYGGESYTQEPACEKIKTKYITVYAPERCGLSLRSKIQIDYR